MGKSLRLRRIEAAIAHSEREHGEQMRRRLSEIEIAELIIVAEVQAHACLRAAAERCPQHTARPVMVAPTTREPVNSLARLATLQALTGESGPQWQGRVERLLHRAETSPTAGHDPLVAGYMAEATAALRGLLSE